MRMKPIFLIILLACILPMLALANALDQRSKFWTNFRVDGDITKDTKWVYLFDVHIRFRDQDPAFDQAIFRPSIGYHFDERWTAWFGYDFLPKQSTDDDLDLEQRFWQQLSYKPVITEKFKLTLQSRVEQRENFEVNGVAWRWRQKILMLFPGLLGRSVTPLISDGLYFNMNRVPWITKNTIDQNRLTAGVLITCSHQFDLGVFYVNQYLVRDPNNIMNHVLYVSLQWDLGSERPVTEGFT